MAERGTEKMTQWLDIHLDSLSSEDRIRLIEEICETLTPQELLTIRDKIERRRENMLVEAGIRLTRDTLLPQVLAARA